MCFAARLPDSDPERPGTFNFAFSQGWIERIDPAIIRIDSHPQLRFLSSRYRFHYLETRFQANRHHQDWRLIAERFDCLAGIANKGELSENIFFLVSEGGLLFLQLRQVCFGFFQLLLEFRTFRNLVLIVWIETAVKLR